MPESVVIDTSVTLRMVLDHRDEQQDAVVALTKAIAFRQTSAHIVDLCLYEMINVMARKWRFSERAIQKSMKDFLSFDIDMLRIDNPLALATAEVAVQKGISGYDAAHLAAAQSIGASLITADTKLAEKGQPTALALGSLSG